MASCRRSLTTSLFALIIFAVAHLATTSAQTFSQGECADQKIVVEGCNATDVVTCTANCGLYGTTYLLDKCCKHTGINANILAFEESATWIPRIEEYGRCTGANIRLQYVDGGEDEMGSALIQDVGENDDETTGQGIYDAYIVQAPWLPPVYKGLKSLSTYIKDNNDYIDFMDINQASRSAVSFEGEVRALPLDTDYISLGWRQDVFGNPDIKEAYKSSWGEELKVPDTIEEMVVIGERLNGRHDFNNDGEMDWGFCLTPQTNYFQAFLAPVLQTHLRECEKTEDGYMCLGANTGQNMFFDVNNFEPLIHNDGFRYAVEMYTRFIMASNCQVQTAAGVKCDRKTAFPTGRCAGVISMPGTMTNLLRENGKYTIPPEKRMDYVLEPGEYWGRRKVFPGSRKVINWNKEGRPLEDCQGSVCPLAKDGINYAPFFAEGGESYALNGRQSKPAATDAMWDMFTWLATLPVGEVPLAGTYRKSQLTDEAIGRLAEQWDNPVMAQDLHDLLLEYFRSEEEGGNTVQDLFIIGFSEYNEALDTELHKNLILQDVDKGGLFNMLDPRKSIDPVRNKAEFDRRYDRFIASLAQRYEDVHARQDGGGLNQLYLWRGALDIHPTKSKEEICQDLLATDHENFDKLGCLDIVLLKDLCQSQESDVEEYSPGTCKVDNNNSTIIISVLFGIVGVGLMGGVVYYLYKRYENYQRIQKAHEQLMEATLNESVRALHQLDYPLHLIRGDEFVEEGKLMRHEVLRNTHKLTVLDSLPDVDAFIEAGKHVLFFSHQWSSFTAPDPSGIQYHAMCDAVKELANRNGWDESLKDVFIWVDYSSIPQVNPSTQNLAIRSLAAYASSATYFVIVAPETPHADLDDICDLGTYQRRMWCRAEQVCHSMRNGTEGMYLGIGKKAPLEPVKGDFFQESLHVFDGELTCCRLEHKGMGACDRQSLVIPLLGLYGELFRASYEMNKNDNADALASVNAFLYEIEKHQEEVFPRSFERVMWRKNKRVVDEVLLFGDLIDRMKARITSGIGFAIHDDKATISTKASDTFVRHGASDFLRHGVVHGSGAHEGVQIESAVGAMDNKL
eukprot:CAMPEP_0196129898 /NCGR_PEP_ID=MMETSP0910-20130528/451_1 /TAXON_ID=49265 /ORGANISM="Thalassiosira rotula, Strain GSO102" /LENGTH=1075 /DNA_ID=CAMNT_0041389097 /DNA_START=439 /DNA_END=3666 /DNA_ORIENTATION=-